MLGEALFRKSDLSSYLRQQDAAIEDHVIRNIRAGDLSKSDESIVDDLLSQAVINPLKVDFKHPIKDVQEIKMTVSDGFGDRFEIDGVRATRAFSFAGDKEPI